ncbi:ExeA family protein [Motilimonas pumila]|uniref:AAA family ATPase n=1 Tax=Motilimonas pumila TaxID=2303987 RepID=A0A418YAU0_9GAMM|nr:ExeA family protein [Motilimonas pumila]RJG40087.1 AAA family ATPase [Motilimonas pumila]
MYKEFFGLKESPFSIAPDPDYLYMSDRHKEALAHLMYGLDAAVGGFILLTGEVGTGKTTVCRSLLQELPVKTELAFILNPSLTKIELLATICDEFGIKYNRERTSLKNLFDVIARFLLKNHQEGIHSVLLIDEAQHLSPKVLEQLRLLTNLETDRKKLLQIILIGQPELQALLKQEQLRQLAQRITARYHLLPLDKTEVCHYVRHRLKVAGCQLPVFNNRSLVEIHRQSGGVPRLINLICDRALLAAYANSDHNITPSLITSVATEVRGEDAVKTLNPRPLIYAGAALSVALIAALSVPYVMGFINSHKADAEMQVMQQNVEAAQAISLPPVPEEQALQNPYVAPVQQAEGSPQREPDSSGTGESQETVASFSAAEPIVVGAVPEGVEDLASIDVQTPVDMQYQRRLEKVVADSRSMEPAMQNLYRVWGYDVPLQDARCENAIAAGLHCLEGRGSVRSLKEMNHPAVVKMLDKRNQTYFATLTHAKPVIFASGGGTKHGFVLLINDKRVKVSENWFNEHWSGEYTLFWKAPAGYERALGLGAEGAAVQWLDDSLAQIYNQDYRSTQRFDGTLQERVMRFQNEHNLGVDGIAGVQTLLRINTAVLPYMPKLLTEG